MEYESLSGVVPDELINSIQEACAVACQVAGDCDESAISPGFLVIPSRVVISTDDVESWSSAMVKE